jgi:hypothetical protein
MAKSAKKQKKKRKKKKRALVQRLRRLGLPERSAENIAGTLTNVTGQLPQPARDAVNELIAKVDDLRGRDAEGKPGDRDVEAAVADGKTADQQAKKAGKKKAKKAKKAAKKRHA